MKRVLYIAEGYVGSKVHHELCKCLAQKGLKVTLFCVERGKKEGKDLRSLYKDINYEILNYNLPDTKYTRYKYDFWYKIRLKYDWLKQHVDLNKFDLVHASTIFSEGAVAYKIYKDYGIPYILNVRGTDTGLYLTWMVHLWPLGYRIINNAKKIVCISNSLDKNLVNKFFIKTFFNKEKIKRKTFVIPNGIEQFWIENANFSRQEIPKDFIYIGSFDHNKNVISLMKAFLALSAKYPNIKMTLIGGGGDRHKDVEKLCNDNPQSFEYLGKIYDKVKLLDVMRQMDIFAMVSHTETFGLVYVEAMSQGLPVLYTKDQGIDGLFQENIGEGANSHNIDSIKKGLEKLMTNFKNYDFIDKSINRFEWDSIGNKYINDIYKDNI